MLPRERVQCVIDKKTPDRMPVYFWAECNLNKQITEMYGSMAAFEDKYEFDYAHLFGGPPMWDDKVLQQIRTAHGGEITPDLLMDLPMFDPNRMEDYHQIVEGIRHHKEQRGRFVYVQTSGVFEPSNGALEIQNHLADLLLYPDEIREFYQRLTKWNIQVANNMMDLGVDMIHVSDDWGAQNGLLFNPKYWWSTIFPFHKVISEQVKKRGFYLSLHSDGNVLAVADGLVELGYDVVHPWQESAGMSYDVYLAKYKPHFTIMGGLDIQTTLGFGNYPKLEKDIRRIMGMFPDKRLLFCTTHFVQDHCTMEELKYACELVYDLVRA